MLTIYFASHLPEAITPKLRKLIAVANVISVELAHDGPNAIRHEQALQEVSDGIRRPEDAVTGASPMYPFALGFLKELHGSRKRIVVERSPVSQTEYDEMNCLFTEANNYWKSAKVELAIAKYRDHAGQFANQMIRRDTDYADQLHQLTEQPNGILSVRGSLHSETLPPILRTKGVDFEPIVFRTPYVLSCQEEVTMKIVRGQSHTKEDILRCLIQQDLEGQDHSYEKKLMVKKELSAMTSEDLSNHIKAKHTRDSEKVQVQ
jgi:hypothetical protein